MWDLKSEIAKKKTWRQYKKQLPVLAWENKGTRVWFLEFRNANTEPGPRASGPRPLERKSCLLGIPGSQKLAGVHVELRT